LYKVVKHDTDLAVCSYSDSEGCWVPMKNVDRDLRVDNAIYEKRIAALEAENKRLREGWVSVEDRLPEIGGEWNESVYVLAVGYMFSEPISCFYTERTGWEFASPLVKGKPERVTHWQPLPTPPRKRRINCK
jgi:hypothetical protein